MPKTEKLVYIVSDIGKALAFEWVALRLKSRFELTFVLIGSSDSELQRFLETNGVRCIIVSDGRYRTQIQKWIRVFRILAGIRPDIIHTHLWRANLLGLTTSWLLRTRKRVLTRHHAMLHYIEYPSGRKWDLLCNFLATDVIAISRNVSEILIEQDGIVPSKVHLIHHGFDSDYFNHVGSDRIVTVRSRHGIDQVKRPVIGVIARYVKWKGIQYIIPAFRRLLDAYPDAILVLANTHGDYASEIKVLLAMLPKNSFVEILYEDDLAALFRLFDLYVHVPTDSRSEAFGQTYVEALTIGVPSVFTLSGIAPEFVVHEFNALVVPFQESSPIYEGFLRILGDPDLCDRLIANGKSSTSSFSIDKMTNLLVDVYEQ
jgi:glycosyltransferase involved in cell wall biosynthesis